MSESNQREAVFRSVADLGGLCLQCQLKFGVCNKIEVYEEELKEKGSEMKTVSGMSNLTIRRALHEMAYVCMYGDDESYRDIPLDKCTVDAILHDYPHEG
jgi:hypothetical protein